MNCSRLLVWIWCLAWGFMPVPDGNAASISTSQAYIMPVQVPYFPPPKAEFPDIPSATPAPKELTQKDLDRAEALLPLLEGRQEYYAMGEFNHLGKPVVPILVKGLTMASPRIRYNTIETLSMIKDPDAIPHLLETGKDVNEMTRIRTHALRVAVEIDPQQVIATFKQLTNDPEETIRRTVAVQSRSVQHLDVLYLLTDLLADSERFVATEALHSFWRLTRYSGPPRNWEGSNQKQRQQWAKEWRAWLNEHADHFREPGQPAHPQAK
ncbi:MAG: HEAT repeat domain-containing protein [Nitrospirales bacterium]|nr:HEAT repeat domain-containing protein [Nitrospirales bacterium]